VLPVVVVVLVVAQVSSALSTAAWLLVAAAATTALARALALRRPLPPVASALVWRHAGVMALLVGAMTWVVVRWDVAHGYWAVATVCVVLRPVADETTRAARDRVLGTLAGAFLAVAVGVLLPGWAVVVAAAGCGLGMIGWLVAGNQRKYVVFLTPVVVLGAAAGTGSAFDLAAERLVLSAVGAVVGAGAAVGLRAYERGRVPSGTPSSRSRSDEAQAGREQPDEPGDEP
jgi:uncharacterized membrane protein YccC